MGRKRKNPEHKKYPERVYPGKCKFEFHPPGGGSVSLCALDSPLSLIWARFEEENGNIKVKRNNFAGLIQDFFASADYLNLAAETQRDYKKYANKLYKPFGAMLPDDIKPQHVRKYMDLRGVKSRAQANREKTFMSRVFRWAYERGHVKCNPCTGVKKFKEAARDRYITDDEYAALYSVAPVVVRVAMEIAYLCCARQGDILLLTRAQLLDTGIFIEQGKTGKKQIKAWTPRLRDAIAMADALPVVDGVVSLYVLRQPRGHRYTRDGFNSRWRKAKEDAKLKFPHLSFDFTFHDLKARGISDLHGTLSEKQQISGHKNITQTARYDRKIQVVPVVGGQ